MSTSPSSAPQTVGSAVRTAFSGTNRTRVVCVDDHQFIADGLAARFSSERDLEFVGRLASADRLAAELERLKPDVVLLDLEMPGASPLDAMADALRRHPKIRFIVLSARVRDVSVATAIDRGASGFFSKSETPESLLRGIRNVATGGTAFGAEAAERLEAGRLGGGGQGNPGSATPLSLLSPRELEVLRLVGKGMSRADIARQLVRSLKTIDAHHTSIMRKLDIHDRAELTRYAIREGLVEA